MRILVVGAGYVGERWALECQNCGHSVTAVVRTEESRKRIQNSTFPALDCLAGDVAEPELWGRVAQNVEVVLYCPSTRGGEVEGYRHIHETGVGRALEYSRASGARFFYTSSTSVFSQNDGGWAREADARPGSEKARILLAAEERVLSFGGTVLRLSGIYGPGRMYHLRRLEQKEEKMPQLPGDGSRIMNMIHRDDICGALNFLLAHPEHDGQLFNVTDDEPVSLLDFYSWLCPKLGKPVPPVGGEETGFSRGITNKRISNRKLRSLGWELTCPTFREGYAEWIDQG